MSHDDTTQAETSSQPPSGRSPWLRLVMAGGIGLALLLVAFALRSVAPEDRVDSVRLEQKAGLVDLPNLNDGGGNLDYYLKFVLADGSFETGVKKGPIGNGLSWTLSSSPALSEVLEVQVWDKDPLQDDMLDRIGIRELRSVGQTYTIELTLAPESALKSMSWVLLGVGASLSLLTLLLIVRRLAV